MAIVVDDQVACARRFYHTLIFGQLWKKDVIIYYLNCLTVLKHLRFKDTRCQCDQIWRNFATLATFYESLSKGLFSVGHIFEPTLEKL